jgi:hypothetical protein
MVILPDTTHKPELVVIYQRPPLYTKQRSESTTIYTVLSFDFEHSDTIPKLPQCHTSLLFTSTPVHIMADISGALAWNQEAISNQLPSDHFRGL